MDSSQLETFDVVLKDPIETKINEIQSKRSIEINVLLVGKTKNGKSTLLRMLDNPRYINPEQKIHSTTKEASYNNFSFHEDEKSYNLNIIDTQGLHEIKNKTDQTYNDEQILKVIQECLMTSVRKLSCICLVFSTTILNDDLQVFAMLKNFLGDEMSERTMLSKFESKTIY